MAYFIVALLGMIGGGVCVFIVLEAKRRRLEEQKRQQAAQAERIEGMAQEVELMRQELDQRGSALDAEREQFDKQVVSYKELEDENAILKRDLQNIDVTVRKLELDREVQQRTQETLDQRSQELGGRYLKENVKWIGSSLTPNNYTRCKERLRDVIQRCREIGCDVPSEEEVGLLAALKEEYERVVRAAFEREEQARIKAQIREEQLREKEIERQLSQLERERAAIQAALDKALAEARDEHSAEVERLRAQLAEAEEKSQRAVSQAQLTKSGHVYVISNVGSFGEGIFKIGLTRRLEPMDRIRELGDASVPFPFDVHMMISSDDAPTLEHALHHAFHRLRLNKVNPRKEFYRTDVEAIRRLVEEHHGEVQYVADAEALEYRQSLTMSDEDEEFIEGLYERLDTQSQSRTDDG